MSSARTTGRRRAGESATGSVPRGEDLSPAASWYDGCGFLLSTSVAFTLAGATHNQTPATNHSHQTRRIGSRWLLTEQRYSYEFSMSRKFGIPNHPGSLFLPFAPVESAAIMIALSFSDTYNPRRRVFPASPGVRLAALSEGVIFRLESAGLKISQRVITAFNTERTPSRAGRLRRSDRLSGAAASWTPL